MSCLYFKENVPWWIPKSEESWYIHLQWSWDALVKGETTLIWKGPGLRQPHKISPKHRTKLLQDLDLECLQARHRFYYFLLNAWRKCRGNWPFTRPLPPKYGGWREANKIKTCSSNFANICSICFNLFKRVFDPKLSKPLFACSLSPGYDGIPDRKLGPSKELHRSGDFHASLLMCDYSIYIQAHATNKYL